MCALCPIAFRPSLLEQVISGSFSCVHYFCKGKDSFLKKQKICLCAHDLGGAAGLKIANEAKVVELPQLTGTGADP